MKESRRRKRERKGAEGGREGGLLIGKVWRRERAKNEKSFFTTCISFWSPTAGKGRGPTPQVFFSGWEFLHSLRGDEEMEDREGTEHLGTVNEE